MGATLETHANGINGHGQTNGPPIARGFSLSQPPLVEDLKKVCDQQTNKAHYPNASDFPEGIPVYDMSQFAGRHDDEALVGTLQDEWSYSIAEGPGVVVLRGLYKIDGLESVLDAANTVFDKILQDEKSAGVGASQTQTSESGYTLDRNLKTYNAFTKLAVRDPETFVAYYSNPWLKHVAEAWVGPGYRINATLNIVPPGGFAQPAHRDYHMGFFDAERCVKFPRLVQMANQILTLQGAVAHTDMPSPSGPTRFLPFSQKFEAGYMAHRRQEFQDHFKSNYISVPLEKGDGVFFNPSILHAAGDNTTEDFYRSAHLIQINSNFGKPSEYINPVPIIRSCWDTMAQEYAKNGLSSQLDAVVVAVGDGYPFPTTLDRIVSGGDIFAMKTEQELLRLGLEKGQTRDEIVQALKTAQGTRLGVFFDES
ncbi:hypothetical protein EDB80DRAFT_818173 [Ilyonectria destructans]|nr:hypothetical protein EDB80DRAFT_818173 [Ilyonectria destructans]